MTQQRNTENVTLCYYIYFLFIRFVYRPSPLEATLLYRGHNKTLQHTDKHDIDSGFYSSYLLLISLIHLKYFQLTHKAQDLSFLPSTFCCLDCRGLS